MFIFEEVGVLYGKKLFYLWEMHLCPWGGPSLIWGDVYLSLGEMHFILIIQLILQRVVYGSKTLVGRIL